jgi:hypothetical protein
MSQLHMDHLRAHLARVREGHTAVGVPQSVYLGADDGEFFEELIGIRLDGMGSAILAALRFQDHGLPGIPNARESLASYLTKPPRAPQSGPFAAPAGHIAALMPRANESIPAFLRGRHVGRVVPSIVIDPAQIRVAFDFRAHNPSALDTLKKGVGPMRRYAVRTVAGHVLTARSVTLGSRQSPRFIALADVVQFTPSGRVNLPDLMLAASWIGLWSDVTEETERLATALWTPFLPSEANSEIVLGLSSAPITRLAPEQSAPQPVVPESRFPEAIKR